VSRLSSPKSETAKQPNKTRVKP